MNTHATTLTTTGPVCVLTVPASAERARKRSRDFRKVTNGANLEPDVSEIHVERIDVKVESFERELRVVKMHVTRFVKLDGFPFGSCVRSHVYDQVAPWYVPEESPFCRRFVELPTLACLL